MKQYTLKAEAALKQPIDPEDNEAWENASDEYKSQFIADMQRDLALSLREKLGETGEVIARVWMEETNEDSSDD